MSITDGMKVFIICLAIFVFPMMVYDEIKPLKCVESSKVVSILDVEYRSAHIMLENGNIVKIIQETIKPGDQYCTKYSR